jgi:hypothetical protein
VIGLQPLRVHQREGSIDLLGSLMSSHNASAPINLACDTGAAVMVVVHARTLADTPVLAGGDVLHVDFQGKWLRASPSVTDHGNGLYSASLPCSAFRENDGVITVAVRLTMQLRRPSLPEQLWNAPRTAMFGGWDELPLFDTRAKWADAATLRNLYQCVDLQYVGGRAFTVRVTPARSPAAALKTGMKREKITNAERSPRACSPGPVESPYFSRCPEDLTTEVRERLSLGYGRGAVFDHCVYSGTAEGCHYAYLGSAEALRCLRGKRLLLLGDSVTSATYRDILSTYSDIEIDHSSRRGSTQPAKPISSSTQHIAPAPAGTIKDRIVRRQHPETLAQRSYSMPTPCSYLLLPEATPCRLTTQCYALQLMIDYSQLRTTHPTGRSSTLQSAQTTALPKRSSDSSPKAVTAPSCLEVAPGFASR